MFDGVHVALEAFNQQRKTELDRKTTDRFKRRRIELKVERTLDSHRRKQWSKKHGQDVYGDRGDSDEEGVELRSKVKQASAGEKCKACGSTSHLRSNHPDCPYNKRLTGNTDPLVDVNDDSV